MPRPLERLPFALSVRSQSQADALLVEQGKAVDVAIAGIPFLLATSPETPQLIETVPVRKEQLDTEADPGEQSLGGWWRRSQDSFHEGAGNLYQERRSSNDPVYGFFESEGINPWVENSLTLHRRMVESAASGTFTKIRTYTDNTTGDEYLSVIADGDLDKLTTPSATPSTIHDLAGALVDGFMSGASFYTLSAAGTLYEGLESAPGSASSWPLTDGSGVAHSIGFGKHRLWAIGGRYIWQPDLTLASTTAQDPVFTNPNAGFQYQSMAEGPAAMYFAGHDGRVSSIQAITLDNGGGVPTLSGASVSAVLPPGELVSHIEILAGSYIGIGTNKGFRIGVVDSTSITYGPLLLDGEVTGCTALTSFGRFFLAAFTRSTNLSAVYRFDTGLQLSEGVFPYATDIECTSTTEVDSLTIITGDRVMATADTNIWYQHATELVPTGTITTGRIRFRTNEHKLFKSLDIEAEPLEGTLSVSALQETGGEALIGGLTVQGELPVTMAMPGALGSQKSIALRFTLNRDSSDATKGPEIHSYLVRALPSVKPQRFITLPLLCFDREQAHSGQWYGYEGWGADRLDLLHALEDLGDTFTYQDFQRPTPYGQTVIVESMQFIQTRPGVVGSKASGVGGLVNLRLRTVVS